MRPLANILIGAALAAMLWPAPAPANLSAPQRTMLADGDFSALSAALDQAAEQIDAAEELAARLRFYRGATGRAYAARLQAALAEFTPSLSAVAASIEALFDYLDEYEPDDWIERFGQTGVYDQVRELLQRSELLQARRWYLAALSEQHSGPDPAAETTTAAHALLERLRFRLDSPSVTDEGRFLLQWRQLRLLRALSAAEPAALDTAHRLLETARAPTWSVEQAAALRFEAVEIAALRAPAGVAALRQAAELEAWLAQHRRDLDDYPAWQLRAAMLIETLRPDNTEVVGDISPPGLRALETAAQELPPLVPTIAELVAEPLAPLPDEAATETTAELGDFQLACLVRHAFYGLADCQTARRAAEAFLQSRPRSHSLYPRMLYMAGRCRRERAALAADSDDTAEALATVRLWRDLAENWPHWRADEPWSTGGSLAAAAGAAEIAYRLYAAHPQAYAPTAREALATLVGRCEDDAAGLHGPFADTPAARAYRYHYGMVLATLERWPEAHCAFAAVPHDDARHLPARYQAVRMLWRQQQSAPAAAFDRQPLLDELSRLRREMTATAPLAARIDILAAEMALFAAPADGPAARQLLADLATPAGRQALPPSLAQHAQLLIAEAHRINDAWPETWATWEQLLAEADDETLAARTLALAAERLGPWRQALANQDYQTLAAELRAALPAVRAAAAAADDALRPTARRCELETASAAALVRYLAAASGQPTQLPDIPTDRMRTLLAEAQRDEQAQASLWLARCQAITAMASGDYEAARRRWRDIRLATPADSGADMACWWWEARTMSLYCLISQGQTDDLGHIITVALASRGDEPGLWTGHINYLRQRADQLTADD